MKRFFLALLFMLLPYLASAQPTSSPFGPVPPDNTPYGVAWNDSFLAPTQNAVYDVIQGIPAGLMPFWYLNLYDWDASNILQMYYNENDVADRWLYIYVHGGNRHLDLAGSIHVEALSRINQDLTNDATPTWVNAILTGLTNGRFQYKTAAGFADSPLSTDGTDVDCSGAHSATSYESDPTPAPSADFWDIDFPLSMAAKIYANAADANNANLYLQVRHGGSITTYLMPDGTNDYVDLPRGTIKFPATQNPSAGANVLDDYEEGTFGTSDANGILEPSTSGSITCGTTYLGRYTKIGRQVTVTGYFVVSAVASPVGALAIKLPFSCVNDNSGISAGSVITSGIAWTGDYLSVRTTPNSSYATLKGVANNGATSNVDASTVVATDYVIFSLTYFTD